MREIGKITRGRCGCPGEVSSHWSRDKFCFGYRWSVVGMFGFVIHYASAWLQGRLNFQ